MDFVSTSLYNHRRSTSSPCDEMKELDSNTSEYLYAPYGKAHTYVRHLNSKYELTQMRNAEFNSSFTGFKYFQNSSPQNNSKFRVSYYPEAKLPDELAQKQKLVTQYNKPFHHKPKRKVYKPRPSSSLESKINFDDPLGKKYKNYLKEIMKKANRNWEARSRSPHCKDKFLEEISKSKDEKSKKFSSIISQLTQYKERPKPPRYTLDTTNRSPSRVKKPPKKQESPKPLERNSMPPYLTVTSISFFQNSN